MNKDDILKIVVNAASMVIPLIIAVMPAIISLVKSIKEKDRKESIINAVDVAYLIVNHISRKTKTGIDDKLAEAIKIVKEEFDGNLSNKELKQIENMLIAKHEKVLNPHLR